MCANRKQQPSTCAKMRTVEDLVKLHFFSQIKCMYSGSWDGDVSTECSTSLPNHRIPWQEDSIHSGEIMSWLHLNKQISITVLQTPITLSANNNTRATSPSKHTLSQLYQNMGSWCYETLPQKVTHLTPITFQVTPTNGCNFLRNWCHGVKWHVRLWSNVAHISISPSTGRLKQH